VSALFSSYEEAWERFGRAEKMQSFLDSQPSESAWLLTWHIPIESEVATDAAPLREELGRLGKLVVLPDDLLHVRVDTVARLDGPDPDRERKEVERAAAAWAGVGAFAIEFGPVTVFPTAVVAEVHGPGPAELLARLTGQPAPGTFLTHMTLALAASSRPTAEVRSLVEPLRGAGRSFGAETVDCVELCRIRVGPGSLLEPWDIVGTVTLAQ
jgi:2'-5' RNA ligase